MVSYNSTSGMKVPKSTYKAQHRIPLGTLSTNCLMGYGWRTTCMPSFKLSCPQLVGAAALPSAIFFAHAKKGADHTIKMNQWTTSSSTTLTTRCAHNTQVHSLQALAEKRAVASLSGHSCLVALCALAFSQRSQ